MAVFSLDARFSHHNLCQADSARYLAIRHRSVTVQRTKQTAYRDERWGVVNGPIGELTPRDIALLAGADLTFGGRIALEEDGSFYVLSRIED